MIPSSFLYVIGPETVCVLALGTGTGVAETKFSFVDYSNVRFMAGNFRDPSQKQGITLRAHAGLRRSKNVH
jgi:hypothetical protein